MTMTKNGLILFVPIALGLLIHAESHTIRGSANDENENRLHITERALHGGSRSRSDSSSSDWSLGRDEEAGRDRVDGEEIGNVVQGLIDELYPCKTVEQLTNETFLINPEDDENSDDREDRAISPTTSTECGCGSEVGCCRIYNWLLCDRDNNFPYLQCVCNAYTALPPGASDPDLIIDVGDGDSALPPPVATDPDPMIDVGDSGSDRTDGVDNDLSENIAVGTFEILTAPLHVVEEIKEDKVAQLPLDYISPSNGYPEDHCKATIGFDEIANQTDIPHRCSGPSDCKPDNMGQEGENAHCCLGLMCMCGEWNDKEKDCVPSY